MKSAVLTGIRQMEIVDVEDAVIAGPNDVLLKVERVGVCGSDVHYYTTGKIGSQIVEYPYRVGHEFAATVLDVGDDVENVQAGDRVAVEPAMSCWACDQCMQGRPHTCRKLRFLGCPGQAEGCLSEMITMPSECCFKIPDCLSLEHAALAEPLSIGMYAAKLAGDLQGKKVGILGFGPIGISVFLPLMKGGVSATYVTDKIGQRVDVARAQGAAWAGNPDQDDVVDRITEQEPGLLDCVFECCGQQEALDQAIELLKPGGKLMLVGIPQIDRIEFSIDYLRRKEICIQNVRRQNHCMQPAIDFLADDPSAFDFMLTHEFRLDQSKESFDLVDSYSDGVIKAIITFGE
jgi:L-iditol 2-dehydrogenase